MPQKQKRQPAALFALLAVLAFTVVTAGSGATPTAWQAHAVLAIGVFPLILAAMSYFTPVLTRSGAPHAFVTMMPPLALAAGVLAILGLTHRPVLLAIAAPLGLFASLALLLWMHQRGRKAIGGAHPGLIWYEAALGCLALGLLAVTGALAFPEHGTALKRLHLHLNLLGFVGLTAIGTLQVLLPTAGGYQDPAAAGRLRADIKFATAGTVLTALGAAWSPALAWAGLGLWLLPVARLIRAALKQRRKIIGWHGAAVALAGALIGFALALLSGALHAAGVLAPRQSIALFFIAFLFPLVTGAASYLLPLWLLPGAGPDEQARRRRRLAWGGGARTLILLGSGVLAAAGVGWAVFAAAAVLALFLLQLLLAVRD